MAGAPRKQSVFLQLVAAMGRDAALRLSAAFGGRRVHVPQRPKQGSELVDAIGDVAAHSLAKRWRGCYLDVPLGPGRRHRIIELSREGHPVAEIAAEVGCTDRYVYQVRARLRAEGEALGAPRKPRKRKRRKGKTKGKQKAPPPAETDQRSLWDQEVEGGE